jgi:hypothetical protein
VQRPSLVLHVVLGQEIQSEHAEDCTSGLSVNWCIASTRASTAPATPARAVYFTLPLVRLRIATLAVSCTRVQSACMDIAVTTASMAPASKARISFRTELVVRFRSTPHYRSCKSPSFCRVCKHRRYRSLDGRHQLPPPGSCSPPLQRRLS